MTGVIYWFPFVGCLIVEIHDHRQFNKDNDAQNDTWPKIKRVVMRPTAESIWSDIQLLNEEWSGTWTEQTALEMEAQILVITPLLLLPLLLLM